jgi:hypothetical protein
MSDRRKSRELVERGAATKRTFRSTCTRVTVLNTNYKLVPVCTMADPANPPFRLTITMHGVYVVLRIAASQVIKGIPLVFDALCPLMRFDALCVSL